jgi:hypothetical protein
VEPIDINWLDNHGYSMKRIGSSTTVMERHPVAVRFSQCGIIRVTVFGSPVNWTTRLQFLMAGALFDET